MPERTMPEGTMPGEPLLAVEALEAGYGGSRVLHGPSVAIAPGEVVALMGRNGMGKSTLIKCILGILRPTGGSIRFRDARIDRLATHRIARLGIGFVPEGRRIFPSLTVRENLVATAHARPDGRWDLDAVYEVFPRLAERRANMGNQLSGGEQQMLAIGRALMTNPRLLVLDEATEGLAPLVRTEIWHTLDRLKRAGQAILVVDKNVKALGRLADRTYMMEKGRVVWHGASADLLRRDDLVESHIGV